MRRPAPVRQCQKQRRQEEKAQEKRELEKPKSRPTEKSSRADSGPWRRKQEIVVSDAPSLDDSRAKVKSTSNQSTASKSSRSKPTLVETAPPAQIKIANAFNLLQDE